MSAHRLEHIMSHRPTEDSAECYFLTRLPAELRIRIYELVLHFETPVLKLRQLVPGSPNMSLLRTNRQIYEEALAVLYDSNAVAVTRNDFCHDTISALKTPVYGQHIRHLFVTSFAESIVCSFLDRKCSICEDAASGFIAAIQAMPNLKTAVVDLQGQTQAFSRFQAAWNGDLSGACSTSPSLRCVAIGSYELSDGQRRIVFEYKQLADAWRVLSRISELQYSTIPPEMAERLQGIAPDIKYKVSMLIRSRNGDRTGVVVPWSLRIRDEDLDKLDAHSRSEALASATTQALDFLRGGSLRY